MHITEAAVVIGGAPPSAGAWADIADGSFVIAADSGLDHCLAAGVVPDLVIGDMDSVSAPALSAAERAGLEIVRLDPDKDATDTALALAEARRRGATAITVLSGGGDRLDHVLATVLALADPTLARCRLRARIGHARLAVLHGPATADIEIECGTTFSVLPLAGPAEGVAVTGARWPLDGVTLPASTTWGVSNVATGAVHVSVREGVLATIVPLEGR